MANWNTFKNKWKKTLPFMCRLSGKQSYTTMAKHHTDICGLNLKQNTCMLEVFFYIVVQYIGSVGAYVF